MLTLTSSASLDELSRHATRIVQLLGYTGYRFCLLWTKQGASYSCTVSASEAMAHAFALDSVVKHRTDDAVIEKIMQGQAPFLWPANGALSCTEPSAFRTQCYATSPLDGASFPLDVQVAGVKACMCVFDQPREAQVRQDTFEQATPFLTMVSIAMWGKLCGGLLKPTSTRLTMAQTEIVHSLAQGLSVQDIADKTKRSESTIRNQIAAAKKRAQVATLPELVYRVENPAFSLESTRDMVDLT